MMGEEYHQSSRRDRNDHYSRGEYVQDQRNMAQDYVNHRDRIKAPAGHTGTKKEAGPLIVV
jgi:hypothetical protein